MTDDPIAVQRLAVRWRAHAHLVLTLRAEAERSGGRLEVHALGTDAVLLAYRDVVTLVATGGAGAPYAPAPRDLVALVALPEEWPFRRSAAPQLAVLEPADWRHPNARGGRVCLDLAGVLPARLATLVYDNLTLRRVRLDDPVDHEVAAFCRAQVTALPLDPRPLFPSDSDASRPPAARLEAPAPARAAGAGALPARDHVVGLFTTPAPALAETTFVRLAPPAGGRVDEAREAYLRIAGRRLRASAPGWQDGAGVVVDPATSDALRLERELHEVGHVLTLLGDEELAASFLELAAHYPGEAP